jgi:hypothetical protein
MLWGVRIVHLARRAAVREPASASNVTEKTPTVDPQPQERERSGIWRIKRYWRESEGLFARLS